MTQKSEDKAREIIDRKLEQSGWHVCDYKDANIHAHQGVVLRYFPLKQGHGEADYLFYVDGKAAGVIEAKKAGTTLSGVEIQSDKYKNGLPDVLPSWGNPLPFAYESTGEETQFTNGLDPDPRSRNVFSFHRPGTLSDLLTGEVSMGRAADPQIKYSSNSLRATVKPPNPLFSPCWKSLKEYMKKRRPDEVIVREDSESGIKTNVSEIAQKMLDTEKITSKKIASLMETLMGGIGDASLLMAAD